MLRQVNSEVSVHDWCRVCVGCRRITIPEVSMSSEAGTKFAHGILNLGDLRWVLMFLDGYLIWYGMMFLELEKRSSQNLNKMNEIYKIKTIGVVTKPNQTINPILKKL